jgi:integrase
VREIHGRLARLDRETPPCRISNRSRSHRAPDRDAESSKPQPTTGTIARAASEFQQAQARNPNIKASLRALVAGHGSEATSTISAEAIGEAIDTWAEFSQHTRSTYTKTLRRFLKWCEDTKDAPRGVHRYVPKVHQPGHRTLIATDEERSRVIAAAEPPLRFFLQVCADLGVRHRAAACLSLNNYDREQRAFRFTGKFNSHQTLPVTDAIRATIERLPADSPRDVPICNLLWPKFHPGTPPGPNPRMFHRWTRLKKELGIRPDLRIHDLRRTVAEDVWDATHDLRKVQAQLGHRHISTTAVYLANRIQLADLKPVLDQVQAMRRARAQRTP